jgi:hypothetical protein
MRYVTTYAKSEAGRNWMRFVQYSIPTVWLAFEIYFFLNRDVIKNHSVQDNYIILAILTFGLLFTVTILHIRFRRLLNTVFEINEIGIQEMTPGHEKTVRWNELTVVKWIQVNKDQRGLYLKSPNEKMIIWQPLVPDIEDGTIIQFTMKGTKLIHPDGTAEILRADNSYAVRELRKHRPDLAIALQSKPLPRFLQMLFGKR